MVGLDVTATRKDIITQVLAEASGRTLEQAGALFEAMLERGIISESGLEVEFNDVESDRMLQEFREELPGIRRWLTELGLLEETGHA